MVKLVHQPGVKNKEGKKHTIKSRTKATTAFALRQVRDAIVAGGIIAAAQNMVSVPTVGIAAVTGAAAPGIPAVGLAVIGVASFLGSKFIFKGAEKHIIKHRENGKLTKKDAVTEALAVAAPITALLLGGFTPAAVVSIGVGSIALAKKLHGRKKNKKAEKESENTETKTR